MKKSEFPKPRLIREDIMPEQDPMKNYRIKKETSYYKGEEFVRYSAEKKAFGIWVDIKRNWSNLLDSYFRIEYYVSLTEVNDAILNHDNSKNRRNKVEYINFDPSID
jgi:hypothetical protein